MPLAAFATLTPSEQLVRYRQCIPESVMDQFQTLSADQGWQRLADTLSQELDGTARLSLAMALTASLFAQERTWVDDHHAPEAFTEAESILKAQLAESLKPAADLVEAQAELQGALGDALGGLLTIVLHYAESKAAPHEVLLFKRQLGAAERAKAGAERVRASLSGMTKSAQALESVLHSTISSTRAQIKAVEKLSKPHDPFAEESEGEDEPAPTRTMAAAAGGGIPLLDNAFATHKPKITYMVVASLDDALKLYAYSKTLAGAKPPSNRPRKGVVAVDGEVVFYQTPAGHSFTFFLRDELPGDARKELMGAGAAKDWVFDLTSDDAVARFLKKNSALPVVTEERVSRYGGQQRVSKKQKKQEE